MCPRTGACLLLCVYVGVLLSDEVHCCAGVWGVVSLCAGLLPFCAGYRSVLSISCVHVDCVM